MPSLKELEEFKQSFRTIGNEAGVTAERGLPFNDLPLPDTEPQGDPFADRAPVSRPDSGPTDLFQDPVDDSPVNTDFDPQDENPASGDFDFGAFLDTIPDDLSMPEADPPAPPAGDAGDIDFDDGLGDLLSGFADDIEEGRAETDGNNGFGDFGLPEDGGETGAADFGNLDDFGIPDDTSAQDGTDFGDFNLPEDGGDAGAADFGNLDDFGIPDDTSAQDGTGFGDFGLPEDGGEAGPDNPGLADEEMLSLFSEEPSPTQAKTPPADDFSFPEAEDLSGPDGFPETGDIPAGDTADQADDFSGGDFDFSIPDGGDIFSADGNDDFSIPDMDDTFSAGDTPGPEEPSQSGDSFELGGEFFEPAEPQTDESSLGDSFDSFSLDGEEGGSSFSMPESDFNIDDVAFDNTANLDNGFSLAGIDDEFKQTPAPGARPQSRPGAQSAEASAEVEEIQLSQEELSKLERTLSSYPLNLRIACEELIAEQAVAPELMSELIKKLVNGASPKETAALAGKILGKPIPVPKGFEKKTGAELEEEQASFGYIFVHNFLPVLRNFFLGALALISLGFLIYQFIYIPSKANGLYKRGYERIGNGEYARANDNFGEAFRIKKIKKWFFMYAEAFRNARQYAYAEQKYDELLRFYPRDKEGALAYANLETYYLYNYEKADRILRENILDYSVDDREALFAQGENFLLWGDIDPSKLEDARIAFARLMERYGEKDIYLEQMLKYFIRTDNLAQVLPLKDYFMESAKKKISPATLAELGGYLLDKKFEEVRGVPDENIENIEGIRDLLLRAVGMDPLLPESHYHLARYYEHFGNVQDVKTVLERAIRAFDTAPELSAKRLRYRLDAQRRYAQVLLLTVPTDGKYPIIAAEQLIKGIGLYEDALRRRVLARSPEFGRLYADLGDLDYFYQAQGGLESALQYYLSSEVNGWHPPEMVYRMGYVYYHTGNMAEAMNRFFDVSTRLPLNRRLLYTLGNTAFQRGNYYAAQGYYNQLLDLLETEQNRFPTLLPHDRPEHMELAERIMVARNNLGATLAVLAERTGNVNLRTRALVLYSDSSRAWDVLTRNPETLIRLFLIDTNVTGPNQGLVNTKYTLYPEPGFEPLIYTRIDKDVPEPSFWEKLVPPNGLAGDDIPYNTRERR